MFETHTHTHTFPRYNLHREHFNYVRSPMLKCLPVHVRESYTHWPQEGEQSWSCQLLQGWARTFVVVLHGILCEEKLVLSPDLGIK